jgi:hypothetical protein
VKDKLVVDTFDLRGKNELSDTDYRYFDQYYHGGGCS